MYKLTKHSLVIRMTDGAFIPNDPANMDYREYMKWLDGGGIPEPAQTLNEVKAEKLSELRVKRAAASVADVVVNGKTFTAEPETQTGFKRLADRVRRGKPTTLQAVMDADGKPVALTNELLDAIEDAIAANTEVAWNKYGQLAAQVNAATTAEEVGAIVW